MCEQGGCKSNWVHVMLKPSLIKFKRKYVPKLVGSVGRIVLGAILKTCKIEVLGLENFHSSFEKGNCLVMLWHNRLTPMLYLLKYLPKDAFCAAMISNSRDGELLNQLIKKNPQLKAIRVVHHTKHTALKEAITSLNDSQRTVVMITPDGPRGPRYKIKPGIGAAAKLASATIIPLTWGGSNFWQLNSWDKLMIPKPFSKIVFYFGEEIRLSENPIAEQICDWEIKLQQLDEKACKLAGKTPK